MGFITAYGWGVLPALKQGGDYPGSRTLVLEDSLEKLERIRERGQGQPAEPHPPLNQAQPPRLADKLPEPQDRVRRVAALGL